MALGLERGEDQAALRPSLETRAKTIRHDLFLHMQKHRAEYQAYWSPAFSGTSEQEGGASVPTEWDAWVNNSLTVGRCIEGLSLKAAAKRYGTCITVIPASDRPSDRPLRFGQIRSGKSPIFLLLQDGHYRLARLRSGRQWPQSWLQADEARVDSLVDALRSLLIPRHSQGWRPAHTPRSSTQLSWRPAVTPVSKARSKVTKGSANKAGQAKKSAPSPPSIGCRPARRLSSNPHGTAPPTRHAQ